MGLTLGLMLGLACWSGCGPSLEGSAQSTSLKAADRDPAEDGLDLARWPGFRGKNGSGIASGGRPAATFSNTEGLRWKVAVPGSGNSSPVVWDHCVVMTAELAETDPPGLAVLCYDRTDGRLIWQRQVAAARARTHVKNGHASASVATDGKRIFASFGSAGLFCLDFAGEKLWQAKLGDLDHIWGTAASPILYGKTVIQLCDAAKGSYLAAFDQATGQVVWHTPRSSSGCWSTPALAEVDDKGVPRMELIVNGGATNDAGQWLVVGYDPDDGSELWRVAGTTQLVTPTPLVAGGLVYSTSGRNGAIMAIRPGGDGDLTGGRVVWKRSRGGPYIPTGVVYRNRLFVLTDSGRLTCFDAGDGREIWQTKLRGTFTASLIAADGRIYATSERGAVYVVAAADTFELLAQNEMDARCLATPAVADGDLLIRTESELYCIAGQLDDRALVANSATGAASVPTTGTASAPATNPADDPATGPAGNAAAAPADKPAGEPANRVASEPANKPAAAEADTMTDPPVAVTDLPTTVPTSEKDKWPLFRGNPQATGVAGGGLPDELELLWTFSTKKGGFESTAAIEGDTVYVGCLDGNFYAIDLKTGEKRWEFHTDLGFTASAAVRNGLVYVGDYDGKFYCLDAASGQPKWTVTTDAEINSSANFYQDNVLFGSQDGRLYCLKADTGEEVFKYESDDMIQCSPTVVGHRAFVAGCDGRLHVVDLIARKSVADIDIEAPTLCTPAVLGRLAVMGTTGNVLLGVDWQAGKIAWRYENPERAAEFRSSAALTPGAVIVGSRDKLVHAVDIKTGQPLWTFAAKRWVDSSPVIVGNRVLVGSSDGRLYALDVDSGKEVWRFEAGGSIVASPAVAAGRLVIGTDEGNLYCFGGKKDGP